MGRILKQHLTLKIVCGVEGKEGCGGNSVYNVLNGAALLGFDYGDSIEPFFTLKQRHNSKTRQVARIGIVFGWF